MTHLSSGCHGPVIFGMYILLSGACAVGACGTHITRAPRHTSWGILSGFLSDARRVFQARRTSSA